MFKKATRAKSRARVAIDGPAKSGKSFTALRLAFALGPKVAAIDTEFGSLRKYAGEAPDGEGPFDFDVMELRKFGPHEYIAAIHEAEKAGYDALVIDSLSHAWIGEGGILDQKDKTTGNQFTAWAKLTPQQRRLVDAILGCGLHVVATMRSKMEYELVERLNDRGQKVQVPVKLGLAPIQREGMEYEFDLLCSVSQDHMLTVSGSRCSAIDGLTAMKPGASFFRPYIDWLAVGAAPPATNGHADASQINRITWLLAQVGIADDAGLARIKEKYGAADWADLTPEQAKEVEDGLETKFRAAVA